MPFLTQGPEGEPSAPYGVNKTNWKFIGIVVVLAIIVGGGIWWYQNSFEVDDKINSKPCVMWNLSQLREIAELHFSTHNGVYSGFENDSQTADIKKDIERCGGSDFSINISPCGKKYCAEVLLPPAHDWFCVDSLGNLLTTSFASNCSSDYFSCIGETENETAGWQTYRNEEYGFEFSYPPIPLGCENCKILESDKGFNVNTATLKVEDSKGLSFSEFINNEMEHFVVENKKERFIDGKTAIAFDYRFGGMNRLGTTTFLEGDGNNIFVFNFYAGAFCCDSAADTIYEFEFYQAILSTFRFLE